MIPQDILALDIQTRHELWQHLAETVEAYFSRVAHAHVAPEVNLEQIRSLLATIDFSSPLNPREAFDFVVRNLWDCQVHTPHPRYFGLFNPAPTPMSIIADALVAAFNPQLAALSHSPFAVEVEQHLIQAFASQFGYTMPDADGTFTSGGAEANHTAMLTALVHTFPEFLHKGLWGINKHPTLYVSTQSHHSFIKAARACSLGTDAVRLIPVTHMLQMDVEALVRQIAHDKSSGFAPFLVVATAGTTNAGVIDPLAHIADISAHERLWFHVDAAWGGAAAFVPELHYLLEGIERSDSITLDAHKWLSVPMAAGIYLTKHRDILGQTFRMAAEYMPPCLGGMNEVNPYTHSIQWSRRFIGLKVFLSIVVAGWDGYGIVLRHQTAMGDLLRQELSASGWKVVNQTKLPVVCFVDGKTSEGESAAFIEAIAQDIVSSGEAWISTTRLDKNKPVLRACVTNYRTEPEDIHALIHSLDMARDRFYR